MILEEKIAKVAKQGFSKPIKLSMEANAVGFRIIIKNIYTDPIRAIVRELGTNALESHIKAGNTDTPFEVLLPTHNNPTFVIRDYGTGISWEDLNNVYAVMFCSDKRDSNEVNGCFGIGSKSPYAYSDNFTLESYVDGVRYIYSCYIDPEGMPNIAPVDGTEGGIPTDEPNGVKISIPVNRTDIYQFTNVAKDVYSYFRYKPNVVGATIVPPSYRDIPYDWKIRTNGSGMNVIMGDVSYKVTIGNKLGKYAGLAMEPIDVYVNIGDVSIDSGRERIVADIKTVDYLKSKLEQVVKDCEEYVSTQLVSAPTYWELKIRARDISHTFMSQYASEVVWQGKKYNFGALTSSIVIPNNLSVVRFLPNLSKKLNVRGFYASEDTRIVYLDKCVGPHVRCMEYASSNGFTVLGISAEPADFKDFVDTYGVDWVNASTLFKPTAPKVSYDKYRSVVKFLQPTYRRYRYGDYWTKDNDFDINEPGFYVITNRGGCVFDGKSLHPQCIVEAIRHQYIKGDIYGIPKSLEDDLKQNGWVNALDEVQNTIKKLWDDEKCGVAKFYDNNIGQLDDVLELLKFAKPLLTNKAALDIMDYTVPSTSRADILNRHFASIFDTTLKGEPDATELTEVKSHIGKINQLVKNYPLLTRLDFPPRDDSDYRQAISSYLNK